MLLNTVKHKALSPEDSPVSENLQLQQTLTAPSKNTTHLHFCSLISNLLHKIKNTPAAPCIYCMFWFRIKDKIWMIFFICLEHLYNCKHVFSGWCWCSAWLWALRRDLWPQWTGGGMGVWKSSTEVIRHINNGIKTTARYTLKLC